jgi:hypothetical protein
LAEISLPSLGEDMAIIQSRYTNLKMVQKILNDMDSDQVSNITDTVESQQVFSILEDVYFQLMNNREWADNERLVRPWTTAPAQTPNVLKFDIDIKEITRIDIDTQNYQRDPQNSCYSYESPDSLGTPRWKTVDYLSPDEFLTLTNGRDLNNSRFVPVTLPAEHLVDRDTGNEFTTGDTSVTIDTEADIKYWTSFDNRRVVFDAARDFRPMGRCNTKALVKAHVYFDNDQDAIQDVPANFFPLWLEKAKAACSYKLRQVTDNVSEQEWRRQSSFLSRKQRPVARGIKRKSYGRRAKGTYHRNPTFEANK